MTGKGLIWDMNLNSSLIWLYYGPACSLTNEVVKV